MRVWSPAYYANKVCERARCYLQSAYYPSIPLGDLPSPLPPSDNSDKGGKPAEKGRGKDTTSDPANKGLGVGTKAVPKPQRYDRSRTAPSAERKKVWDVVAPKGKVKKKGKAPPAKGDPPWPRLPEHDVESQMTEVEVDPGTRVLGAGNLTSRFMSG